MAPLSTDPRQVLVVLNPARRKALYTLSAEVTSYMRRQLELPHPKSVEPCTPEAPRGSSQGSPPPPYAETDEAPVSLPRTAGEAAAKQPQPRSDSPRSQPPPNRRPSPELVRLRTSAMGHFDAWRSGVLGKLKELLASPDDQQVLEARRKRTAALAQQRASTPSAGEDLLDFGADAAPPPSTPAPPVASIMDVGALQSLYHPIPTRLATVDLEDRQEVLSSVLLLLLSIGNYSAYSRTFVCYMASALEVPPAFLDSEEVQIATTMMEAAQKAEAEKKKNNHGGGSSSGMSAEAEAQQRKEQGQKSRFWKVGLASVAGAAIIGVTGGLAAPVVAGAIGGLMGSVGLGGLASFLGIFWMNGALVGTLFGAFGASMTGQMIDQYAKEVEDFRFLPLKDEWGRECRRNPAEARRLRVTIGVNGWLNDEGDVTKPWRALGAESEVFALRYEMKSLLGLGKSLEELVSSYAWGAIKAEILKRTVLVTLWSALWPAYLISMASSIDNPFNLARNRSEKAGKILADALINRVQGERPVTLVGYSLGARVIYSCLMSLAERRAFGLVDTVVLVAAPVPSNPAHWQMMRAVVTGKMYNVYSQNDYILAFLYRATSAQLGIAGLQAISADVEGVENLDLSSEVTGHLRYPELMPKILTRCGFPHVRGGSGTIEKENDPVKLRDDDFAETCQLIDFGEPSRGEPTGPSQHSEQKMANEKFDSSVKDLIGLEQTATGRSSEPCLPASAARGHDGPFDPSSSQGQGLPAAVEERRPGARAVPSPPVAPPIFSGHGGEDSREGTAGADSDDEEFQGIRMEDNDADGDMVVYTEALRLED